MKVTVVEVYIDKSGKRRDRVCLRKDGYFQIGLEHKTEEDGDYLPYWRNEHPPSGLFASRTDAIEAVQSALINSKRLDNLELIEIDLSVGPWPAPEHQQS